MRRENPLYVAPLADGPVTCPKSNRFIATYDPMNLRLQIDRCATFGDWRERLKDLAALQPKGAYVVVDSAENRLRLMRKDEVVLEAIASAGTGAVLVHTYAVTGVYTAVVTASNSLGMLQAATAVTVAGRAFRIYLPLIWRGG